MKEINEKKLKSKLARFATLAGAKVVYVVLLLFYAYKRKDTPGWAKASILGSIAYFLSPIDFIPDLTPLLGFTDDLGVLLLSLTTVGMYINQDVKNKAKEKLSKWFSEEDISASASDIENKLKESKK